MLRAPLIAVLGFVGGQTVAATPLVLQEGTPISVQTLEELSSKKAQTGDPVQMEVTDDVTVGNTVVIPAGSPAYGEVTDAERNGHVGKSGHLTVEVSYIKMGDRRIRVRGKRDVTGAGGGGATIATVALLSPLGLLTHGRSASVPLHTKFTAYVGADTPIELSRPVAGAPIVLQSGKPRR